MKKEKIFKNTIITSLSLLFDLDKKKINSYLEDYKIIKNKIEILLIYPQNIKLRIKILKRITKEDLVAVNNEIIIIIKIIEKNQKILSIKKINTTTLYTLDIKTGYNLSKRDLSIYSKRIQNLVLVSLSLMNLKHLVNKKHVIIKKRRKV